MPAACTCAASRCWPTTCCSSRTSADPHRLQQCLTALVDNALLYSDGPVTLAASTGPGGELVLHVIDRGPGSGADFQLLLPGLAGIGCEWRGGAEHP
jgi:hypothetical protein